jgi:hypothetical protein
LRQILEQVVFTISAKNHRACEFFWLQNPFKFSISSYTKTRFFFFAFPKSSLECKFLELNFGLFTSGLCLILQLVDGSEITSFGFATLWITSSGLQICEKEFFGLVCVHCVFLSSCSSRFRFCGVVDDAQLGFAGFGSLAQPDPAAAVRLDSFWHLPVPKYQLCSSHGNSWTSSSSSCIVMGAQSS